MHVDCAGALCVCHIGNFSFWFFFCAAFDIVWYLVSTQVGNAYSVNSILYIDVSLTS